MLHANNSKFVKVDKLAINWKRWGKRVIGYSSKISVYEFQGSWTVRTLKSFPAIGGKSLHLWVNASLKRKFPAIGVFAVIRKMTHLLEEFWVPWSKDMKKKKTQAMANVCRCICKVMWSSALNSIKSKLPNATKGNVN